jgi:hypothetical protein
MQDARALIAKESACTSEKITVPIPVQEYWSSFPYKPMMPKVIPLKPTRIRYVHDQAILNNSWAIKKTARDVTGGDFIPLSKKVLHHMPRGSDTMERFLNEYIQRMQLVFPGFPAMTAHEIASAFLAFKFGLYANAVRECERAISRLPEVKGIGSLKTALMIVSANARDRENSQVSADMSVMFSDADVPYLAIRIPPEKIDDPGTLNLDNALILIYVVAIISSPDDEEALEEHRRFIVRILTDYKKSLGTE